MCLILRKQASPQLAELNSQQKTFYDCRELMDVDHVGVSNTPDLEGISMGIEIILLHFVSGFCKQIQARVSSLILR